MGDEGGGGGGGGGGGEEGERRARGGGGGGKGRMYREHKLKRYCRVCIYMNKGGEHSYIVYQSIIVH